MRSRVLWVGVIGLGLLAFVPRSEGQKSSGAVGTPAARQALVQKYCVGCHSDSLKTGGLTLQHADFANIPAGAEVWEKVIRKVRVGAMPPQGAPRPDGVALNELAASLEGELDANALKTPNPGRVSVHRLNRVEYANAVHDLLDLKIDGATLLPADDESSGFDNIADVLRMSPALMERYLSASWNISRLAVGNMKLTPVTTVYRVRPDLSQDQHMDGMPLGTIGGILAQHTFPLNAEYSIKLRMWRNTFDLMRGVEDPHEIEIAVDGALVKTVKVGGREDFVKMAENPGAFGGDLDQKLTVRVPLTAGVHTVTAYSRMRSHAQRDALVKPFLRTTVDGQEITGDPSVDRLTIEGPFQQTGVGETNSRRKIFSCYPTKGQDEVVCARQILTTLARHAYRRPPTANDLESLLGFFQKGRSKGGSFDAGIESALQLILASPEFLVRFEQDPDKLADGAVYKISDMALASRLSFFLWSSIPDDELLDLATKGNLSKPAVLKAQMQRMLRDPKAIALIDNFAEQWLFLRNLKTANPDLTAYPDFDDNLRQAMREETRMLLESVIRDDRSVMDLMNADYTFVNERLARHYGIPNVYGSQFRKVAITDENRRGLLGQASILTVTSYPNRTSAVQRGKWVLTNILGVPPTPPPPNVPTLKENAEGERVLSLRERMEAHRANPVCAGCHKVMDPIGFSLENFDATGRWRASDDGSKIDPSGVMFDGSKIEGPASLRKALTRRPEVFVGVMTEKLLTYALGRGLGYSDMPTVRRIVSQAGKQDFRFSALVSGIVDSAPFEMKVKRSQSQVASLEKPQGASSK
ncbi:MAG: DUF1592 domain-containing protein [Acidobacteriota bacterium]